MRAARERTGPALFAGGPALEQLWLLIVAPLAGAAVAGAAYKGLFGRLDLSAA